MIWAKLAVDAVPSSLWLWQHRAQFAPILTKAKDFVGAAVSDPHGAVRRIGNTIVFGQEGGGAKVLGFIEQTNPKIDAIQTAVGDLHVGQGTLVHAVGKLQTGQGALAGAVGAVQVGQQALSSSLASLQTLSMVSLGFTAILPLVLHTQFAALNKRLNTLLKAVRDLAKKFDAQRVAQLKTGIEFLELGMECLARGDREQAHKNLGEALHDCVMTVNYFQQLLSNELNAAPVSREEVRLLARHLSVATLGAAACHIALEDDQNAIKQINGQLPVLRTAAGWVFKETVGKDPVRYLVGCPGVTLEFIADLFRQGRCAGATTKVPEDDTPASWFEEHRREICGARLPRIWRGNRAATLRRELLEAVSIVEETNRVGGMETLARDVQGAGENTVEIMTKVREAISSPDAQNAPYIFWGLSEKAVQSSLRPERPRGKEGPC